MRYKLFSTSQSVIILGLCDVKDFQAASIFLLCLPCCVVYHLVQHCSLGSAIMFAFQPAEGGEEERSRLPAFERISWKPSARFPLLTHLSQHSQWPQELSGRWKNVIFILGKKVPSLGSGVLAKREEWMSEYTQGLNNPLDQSTQRQIQY